MQLTVVKIGGNIIDDKDKLTAFLKSFAQLEGAKILVHGGGKIATDIGAKLGIEAQYVNGRRVTDAETLSLVTMVYGGLLNKNIVAGLQAVGCNAIGLTGADGNILPALKRPIKDVDYGFVGDVNSSAVNSALLFKLLEAGLTPVLAPLTHDGNGSMLNTNADTIAQEVAKAMVSSMNVRLIYCFEKKGVLADAADDESVINSVTAADFEELKEQGIVTGGMLPKLENALAAIKSGVKKVIIGQAEELQALYTEEAGTCIL
jgi:acetylglutamate kinase